MKRFALLLAVIMLMTTAVVNAEEPTPSQAPITVQSGQRVADSSDIQAGTSVTVGTVTEVSGAFAMDMWGNNTADMDVRALLHGYSTVTWTRGNTLMFNGTVVAGVQAVPQENGNRIYEISLMTDLVYNDGTPITAKDYVFSLLLQGAPEVRKIGGMPRGMQHFVGYEAYLSGESDVFTGVRLLSEDSFSLEVDAAYLPFFYGLAMLEATPYPIDVIAPGCDVFDDGEGAYIGRGDTADALDAQTLGFEPGVFSAQMLEITLLDPQNGYISHPYITSGPYMLEAYDAEAKTVSFVVNPKYLGNYEGQRPRIERLSLCAVTNDNMLELLQSGEVDILNKIASGSVIDAAMKLMSGEDRTIQGRNYLRTGMAYLSFACETGVTQYPAVRQAIARVIDKYKIMESITRYGMVVHGYYGLGQWMATYVQNADEELGLEAVHMPNQLATLAVEQDVEAAKQLLIDDGWTLNEQGGAYVEGTDAVRCKEIDGVLTPLVIYWAKTENNTAAQAVHDHLTGAFAAAGIGLQVDEMPFAQMLRHFYRQEPRTYDMFYLASNFLSVFDPYYEYNPADEYQGLVNTTGLQDQELADLALRLRQTEAMDLRTYVLKWFDFQQKWVELMPMVPLYSGIYYGLHSTEIQGYAIDQGSSWADAILYASIGEEAPAKEEALDTGEIEIED